MKKSRIFYTDIYKDLQARVGEVINSHKEFLSPETASSTRAAGDAIQNIITEHFHALLGNLCAEYSSDFARRSMADLAFKDVDGFYYIVDVKTHRTDTKFNMPNLTSVERLTRLYEDDLNYFTLLLVAYHLEGTRTIVSDVKFVPIEFLGWDCLTIGALGWGQIQIANSNYITINAHYPRKKWMLELCDVMFEFYPKEMAKIGERIKHFEEVRDFWLAKPDE